MARLHVMERSHAQAVMDDLHDALGRRLAVSSLAPCPVEFTAALVNLCSTQSCGKCTPCRVGLSALSDLLADVLEGRADESTLNLIERTARTIYLSSDCAIGYEAGAMALTAIRGFRDDFEHHIREHSCGFDREARVPCVSGCPAHVDIPGYISLVEAGRYADAVKVIRKNNPLPLVCGLVCEHPCEQRCRRTLIDAPLNIRGIKEFACEHARADQVPVPKRLPATGRRVAVVGGGPSGLTCAYFAALMGHDVDVFEGRKQLGGMIRYGIPAYRFPRERLDEDIRGILAVGGITVHTESPVDAERMAQLSADYDAVYVAIGAQTGKGLRIDGTDAEGVFSAVDLLGRIGDGDYPDFTGKKVAVIGGGNVAMDCCRTAVRAGAEEVSVVYRRRISDMTALPAEIESAIAEGVEMITLQAPAAIEKDEQGRCCALLTNPQMIGPVKRGRPAPVAADKPQMRIPADIILIAVGQNIVSAPFEEFGMAAEWGEFKADEQLHAQMDAEALAARGADAFAGANVFVGGDCQTGPASAIKAIAAGKVAARNIDHMLGFNHTLDCGVAAPPAQPNDRAAYGRVEVLERPARERKNDFDAVEVPMSTEEAMQECGRCLRCDHFGAGACEGGRIQYA